MLIAWRVAKSRHPTYDGTGAARYGARWNSRGRFVVYAADSFAGGVLEILAHALRPRTLPGAHRAVRIEVPDDVSVRTVAVSEVPRWDARDSPEARRFGDEWYDGGASAVLVVPALTSRPIGRNVLINPSHPDAGRIRVSEPFDVEWDERLF